MLIDRLEFKRQGAGWIVFLAWTQLASLAAFLLACVRLRRLHLEQTPQVKLFGVVPFGNGLAWGLVIFSWGLCMTLAGWSMARESSSDWWMVWLYSVPHMLAGLLLAFYWANYRIFKGACNRLLERIAAGERLTDEDLTFVEQGRTFTPAKSLKVLEELQRVGAIAFEGGDGRYRARIVAPELLAYQVRVHELAARAQPLYTWTCPACGAPNETRAGEPCAWCGGGRPARE